MFRGEQNKSVDMILPFLVRFIDWCTGGMEEAILTKIRVLCSELRLSMTNNICLKRWDKKEEMILKYCVEQVKRSFVEKLCDHCNIGWYTLKIYLLDHIVEDLQAFGTVGELNASPPEQYNMTIENAYWQSSRRRGMWLNETVMMSWYRMNWTQTVSKMSSLQSREEAENARTIDC